MVLKAYIRSGQDAIEGEVQLFELTLMKGIDEIEFDVPENSCARTSCYAFNDSITNYEGEKTTI